MHYPHRRRTVVSAEFFDTEILAPVLEVLETRGAEELGDRELEGVGEFLESLPWSGLPNTCRSMLAFFIQLLAQDNEPGMGGDADPDLLAGDAVDADLHRAVDKELANRGGGVEVSERWSEHIGQQIGKDK